MVSESNSLSQYAELDHQRVIDSPVLEVQDVTEGLGIDVHILLVAKEAKAQVDHDIRPKWIRWARR